MAGAQYDRGRRIDTPTQPQAQPSDQPAYSGPYWAHSGSGLRLPTRVGEIYRKGENDFGGRLGVGVKFLAENAAYGAYLKIDVYVYDLGVRNIPNGAYNPVVRAEFDRAVQDIHMLRRQGRYQEVAPLDSTLQAHAQLLVGRFRIVTQGMAQDSYLVLTGHRGHFVKVRASFLESARDLAQPQLEAFNAMLVDMLGGAPTS